MVMKISSIAVILVFMASGLFAQQPISAQPDAAVVQEWIENLYEIGVSVDHDTFTITKEAQRVASDSSWRKIIYPGDYQWPHAQYLLKNMQIKVGLWYLINLYAENEVNREAVLKYVISLEGVFDMQKALTAAFYTYVFFDPEASDIVDGKPIINRPDILDEKLSAVREMTARVMAHR
jgi:hypothetical protein